MKRKLKSLLAIVLSVGMLAAILPSSMAAGTNIVKDHMDWPNWSSAGYFEGTVYNMFTSICNTQFYSLFVVFFFKSHNYAILDFGSIFVT